MTLEEVMNILLPCSPEKGCPSFIGIGGIALLMARDREFLLQLQQWAECIGATQEVTEEEVIRSFDANDFRVIRDTLLEIYFSHPAVIMAVRGSDAPLFPSGADVAQIDFDMLEPVFERGEIFRKVP